MTAKWTFETLANVNKASLENILIHGDTPDIEQLDGYNYCGWNHDTIGKLTGEKFKKGFFRRAGTVYGYNLKMRQDKQMYHGNWEPALTNGQPKQMGFFKVSYVKDEPAQQQHPSYEHLALFNYNVSINSGTQRFFRVIRDFIVLPNPGDHSLLLGKAYVQLGKKLDIFCCYFLLGYPQKNK